MIHPDLLTASYDFDLPDSLIATVPAAPRDSCRLLVYNRATGEIVHARFSALLDYLPSDTAVLLNDTRVIKARLFGTKATGGRIELLILKPLAGDRVRVYIRGRVAPGQHLSFGDDLSAVVEHLEEDGSRTVIFHDARGESVPFHRLVEILDTIGHIPLPPYIQRDDTQADATEYQTVFAKEQGSVAAPTASLHFTPELLSNLQARHPSAFLTLHVGAGTFKPVDTATITDHPMHSEYYTVPDAARSLIDSSVPILAVGTTVTRTVEYYIRTGRPGGECDLFLHPFNPPRRINHLLTNFHLPCSTLVMLVAAFVGREKTMELYHLAIKEGYRFYSYGDAMLIL